MKQRVAVLGLVALAGAASLDGDAPAVTVTTTSESPGEPTAAAATTIRSPIGDTASTTTGSLGTGSMIVTGPQEIVFDWSSDRCDDLDIPDLPARAFRDADGTVQLISTHTTARRSTGPSLDEVVRSCDPVFESTHDADPSRWADSEWIASTWTPDGTTVYGLVHNEYHGWERGDCAGKDPFACWYNGISAIISTDGGSSYDHVRPPPDHLVAAIPHRYTPGTAPVGLFSPSNIVQGPEGHWYALAKVGEHLTGRQTVCLMRTDDLSDPDAWRFWNGASFDGTFRDPYADDVEDRQTATCPALDLADIGAQMIESLSWNTHLERWVLVGISADTIDGREVWGFYYSFSDDLIDWERRRLLLEVPLPWTVADPGSDLSYLYPSLLDPASESRNFETSGRSAFVYFTRNNAGHASLDRDLVRVPVEFAFEGG